MTDISRVFIFIMIEHLRYTTINFEDCEIAAMIDYKKLEI